MLTGRPSGLREKRETAMNDNTSRKDQAEVPVLAALETLTKKGPVNLRDPESLAALFRASGMASRRSAAAISAHYEKCASAGVPAQQTPEPGPEIQALMDSEMRGLMVLSALLSGQLGGAALPGWAGAPAAQWLASAIPGNLYEKSPSFAEGTPEAAIENFVLIFSHVSGKFSSWEQLLRRFGEPVDEADFEGMVSVFAKLAAGASKSVDLPEAFSHMDFSEDSGPGVQRA